MSLFHHQLSPVEEEKILTALAFQEGRISAPCLKHTPSTTPIKSLGKLDSDDLEESVTLGEEERTQLFSSTVDAVQTIVKEKLYKVKAKSLEAYFNSVWHISRAQVYRYLDCATVLDALKGFKEFPNRERLCRSMKRFAKNPEEIRALWKKVLDLGYRNPVPTAAVDIANELTRDQSGYLPSKLSRKGNGLLVSPALTEALIDSSNLITPEALLVKEDRPTKRRKKGSKRRRSKRVKTLESDREEETDDSVEEPISTHQNILHERIPETRMTPPLLPAKKRGRPRLAISKQQKEEPNIMIENSPSVSSLFENQEDEQKVDELKLGSRSSKSFSSSVHKSPPKGPLMDPSSSPSRWFHSPTVPSTPAPSRLTLLPSERDVEPTPSTDQTTTPLSLEDMELHIATLFSSLDTLTAHGYSLQPFLHGRWESAPITEWRMAPAGWKTSRPSATTTLFSSSSFSFLSGQTLAMESSNPAATSSRPEPTATDLEMQSAARDLYLLSSSGSFY